MLFQSLQDMFMPVTKLMKVNFRKIPTSTFCWDHLVCDLKLLSKAVGKGIDEAAILVHLVLKNILASSPPGKLSITQYISAYISCLHVSTI